jgi:lactate dehydrogenase-like 2-hydroxyacid dehydrogenase
MKHKILMLCQLMEKYECVLDQKYSLIRALSDQEHAALSSNDLNECEVVVTSGGHGLERSLMDKLPNLSLIAVNGVGVDKIDLEEAARRNIKISTTDDVLTDSVADLAIGLILSITRHLVTADRFVRNGRWINNSFPVLGYSLAGRKVGILGLGKIGTAIAQRLTAFGAKVSYHNRRPRIDCDFSYFSTLEELAKDSDILVVAAAGGTSSQGVVSKSVLSALGPEGYLINVARGSVVDELAMISLLKNGMLAGAGLDVFNNEPEIDEQLLRLQNVVLVPHLGSATSEARHAMASIVVNSVAKYFGDELWSE